MFAAPFNLIMLFNIISFSNELSVVTLISQFPFIEREIGFKEPVDPNRSVRANESVKKALIIPHVVLFSYTSTFFGKHQLKIGLRYP